MDGTIRVSDGRTVGFADHGDSAGTTSVLWCHGGPGSRLEPAYLRAQANAAGLRVVGIDRPGYGLSTPQPGRTIADWVPDAVAVADHLDIDQFVTVGTSTGGAFAVRGPGAVTSPGARRARVLCNDRHALAAGKIDDEPRSHTCGVGRTRPRSAALAAAVEAHGEHGSKMLGSGMDEALAPSDAAMFRDPEWMTAAMAGFPSMFTSGLEGYTDDRLADGPGWVSFDVAAIRCPVTVLHGGSDRMVDVIHARHTAAIVPERRTGHLRRPRPLQHRTRNRARHRPTTDRASGLTACAWFAKRTLFSDQVNKIVSAIWCCSTLALSTAACWSSLGPDPRNASTASAEVHRSKMLILPGSIGSAER